jgi:hypothetical protein
MSAIGLAGAKQPAACSAMVAVVGFQKTQTRLTGEVGRLAAFPTWGDGIADQRYRYSGSWPAIAVGEAAEE